MDHVLEIVALQHSRETENPQGDLNRTVDLADEKCDADQTKPSSVRVVEAAFEYLNMIRECEIEHSITFTEETKSDQEPMSKEVQKAEASQC